MNPPLLELITGAAGTGKTYTLKERMKTFKAKGVRKYGVFTATTGIAAINLSGGTGDNVTTLNSKLKYYDTASLQDNFACRKLHNALKEVSREANNLVIDEISMQDKEQLDLIYDALVEVNDLQEVHNRGGLGLILSGDFCQLPPVSGDFAFNARCFSKFSITKLTKVYRQSDVGFLEMLNAARCGDGEKASKLMVDMEGVTIRQMVDSHFDGTTIVPVNRLVDSLNKIRLDELLKTGKTPLEFKSFRWGKQLGEWKNIPEIRVVCQDAYVMILANDAPNFSYANGSCGHVKDAEIDLGAVTIKLVENDAEVRVRKVTRNCTTKEVPEGCTPPEAWLSKAEWKKLEENKEWAHIEDLMYKQYLLKLTADFKAKYWVDNKPAPFYDFTEEKWVIGQVTYTPIRLAYASTAHKTQGLSLDKVQIDYSHPFFGEPSMSYVALSRCRTPAGLTVVGSRKLIEDRTNISSAILDWL